MRKTLISAASVLSLLASPALGTEPDKADKPVTQKEPSPTDVVATPVSDLNLKKDEIPELLLAAEQRPYSLRGLDTCRQLATAIGEFDAVLGDDLDVPQAGGRRLSATRVAQSVVGAFIPFRGVIREISGANQHDRTLQAAILAGVARRSFLKGIGQAKGCRYPARSATLEVYNARMAALDAGAEPPRASPADAEPQAPRRDARSQPRRPSYVSRPVVQRTD
jgi:hypothetical protein